MAPHWRNAGIVLWLIAVAAAPLFGDNYVV